MAVGRGLRGDFRADDAARARARVDDDLLAPGFGELLPDQAPDDVGPGAGRRQRDDADRPGRVGLRLSLACKRKSSQECSDKQIRDG